jgi:hypothetical protein
MNQLIIESYEGPGILLHIKSILLLFFAFLFQDSLSFYQNMADWHKSGI